MRTFFAILAGYLLFAVTAAALFQMTHVDPHEQPGLVFMIGSTLYGMFFAASAGYVAARLARKRELVTAGILAGIIALLAFISIIAQPGLTTYWSQIAAIVFMAPSSVLGGWLRVRQVRIAKRTQK